VYLYGCASDLEEGHQYDLLVEGIKTYNGLKEITHAYKLKDKGLVKYDKYRLSADTLLGKEVVQNEVIKEISGLYRNRFLDVKGRKIPIYFKKKKLTPPNGSRLKIHYAHLGYYKKLQLVIYSKKDFEIYSEGSKE
jgi:hypothetical protein